MKKLSVFFGWWPLIILIGWVDPAWVRDIGWQESYLPLLVSLMIGLEFSLRMVIRSWWKRWITIGLIVMAVYLQIVRASNWFEVGLGLLWLVYLTS